ncbi:MAG: alpha/beta hydrolase [Acidobacteriia bacterium]|nr:alpha/beta hydrolase [Terriglobia bacterium]
MLSVFCLVHGSTQGPKGWDLLVEELRARGHDCVCVDLPTDQPDSGALVYAGAIGRAIENSNGAIVVAHSASGLFLPLVPEYAPVSKLVYLAAVIPLPGESFLSQFQRDQGMYRPDFIGKDPTKDEALARQYLFHDCPPSTAQWALTTLRLMFAKEALIEACPLANWPNVASTYVSCSGDRALSPAWWERAARQRLGVDPIRMEAGHAPHIARPAELATILDSLTTS